MTERERRVYKIRILFEKKQGIDEERAECDVST